MSPLKVDMPKLLFIFELLHLENLGSIQMLPPLSINYLTFFITVYGITRVDNPYFRSKFDFGRVVQNCPTLSITVYDIIMVDNPSFYFTYRSKIYQYLIIDIKILRFLVPLRSKSDLNLWSKVKVLFSIFFLNQA